MDEKFNEKNYLQIWSSMDCVQTLKLPTQSIWCVRFLKNGDIVTGANDGVIRIFTKSPERTASAEILSAYEENVKAMVAEVQSKIGDVDINR